MHRRLLGLGAFVLYVLLAVLSVVSCKPSFSWGASPEFVVSIGRTDPTPRGHAPTETIDELQTCANRFAKRLSDGSYGILVDIKATERRKITSVEVDDSTVDDSDVEECITRALERMEVPLSATAMQQEVSPQSRGMVGVVQAAAAPIALAPIALVAGGVTILVGVTIYVATQAVDAASESLRCREVKEKCIDHCSGPAGLPAPGGGRFRGCMRECMEAQGCSF